MHEFFAQSHWHSCCHLSDLTTIRDTIMRLISKQVSKFNAPSNAQCLL